MKKILALILSISLAFALCACGTDVESKVDDMGSKVESKMENR